MPDYRAIYRTNLGHIRVPFASLGTFMRVEAIRVSIAEARAIENVATFVFSAGILTSRLKAYSDGLDAAPIRYLFLDVQSFFLFIQQFLEDLALIVRMSLPHDKRHQMPPAFSHLMPRLLEDMEPDAPLAHFWSAERAWFGELKDLRDDILHRTAFGKKRSATFSDIIDLLRATGGQPHFVRGTTLASYVGEVLIRVFSLSCLADDLVTLLFAKRHPEARLPLRCGILLSWGEMELSAVEKASRFGLGTPLYSMGDEEQNALEFFINAGKNLA